MELAVFLLLFLLSHSGISAGKMANHKTFPRQMIFPNKFIPMIKESPLFKGRSSSNVLSNFLKPKQHDKADSVTGETRQTMMNSMGMDTGQPQETGGAGMGNEGINGVGMGGGSLGGGGLGSESIGGGGIGGGGLGSEGMGGGNVGSEGMGGLGSDSMGGGGLGGEGMGGGGMGSEGMSSEGMGGGGMGGGGMGGGGFGPTEGEPGMDSLGSQRGIESGQASMLGMNNQMNGMNDMSGTGGQQSGSQNENMGGDGAPPGDPMGTLNSMMSNQGANAALGMGGSQAFGPGGDANSNIVSMLNQIVGKEMPSGSPVNPGSNSEQLWNELQKNIESQKPSGVPYMDRDNTQSGSEVVSSSDKQASQVSATRDTGDKPTKSANESATVTNGTHRLQPTPTQASKQNNSKTTEFFVKSPQNRAPSQQIAKMSQDLTDTDVDEEKPLSDDMVKFLKGVKFVISQESGNDIILGKKFSSAPERLDLKEENGIMKTNVASAGNNEDQGSVNKNNLGKKKQSNGASTIKNSNRKMKDNGRNLLLSDIVGRRSKERVPNYLGYLKAASILRSAADKLKDPVAKKSTDIAITSILKVLSLRKRSKRPSRLKVDALQGGDIKDKMLDKYTEAARVLATASKKIADPVAKQSTNIGIASILKIISLGEYTSKKTLVPFNLNSNRDVKSRENHRYNLIAKDYVDAMLSFS